MAHVRQMHAHGQGEYGMEPAKAAALAGLMESESSGSNGCRRAMDYSDDLDPRCIMCGYHPRVPMSKVHRTIELDRLRELARPTRFDTSGGPPKQDLLSSCQPDKIDNLTMWHTTV